LLPVDRGLAIREGPERLRDRGGEDARVAMVVRLQDQPLYGLGHTPMPAAVLAQGSAQLAVGLHTLQPVQSARNLGQRRFPRREMLPQFPEMIRWPDAAAQRKPSSDGAGDIGLRQRHRFRNAAT
jgi:hypothetical protein